MPGERFSAATGGFFNNYLRGPLCRNKKLLPNGVP